MEYVQVQKVSDDVYCVEVWVKAKTEKEAVECANRELAREVLRNESRSRRNLGW